MIDIICICHKSYSLFETQLHHWDTWMRGDFNLILLDSTPDEFYRPTYYKGKLVEKFSPTSMFDGENSGQSYDYALSQTTSKIVGMTDPDNFFLNPDLLQEVEEDFANGYKCVGAAGYYDDFQSIFDKANPSHRGELAPVLWAQFMDRELALSETWVCSPPGIGQITGWRVREKIIDQGISCKVWQGFMPFDDDRCSCAFGPKDKPKSIHLLKGCGLRANMMNAAVPRALEWGKSFWQ